MASRNVRRLAVVYFVLALGLLAVGCAGKEDRPSTEALSSTTTLATPTSLPGNSTLPPLATSTTAQTTTTTQRPLTARISVEGTGLTADEISASNKTASRQLGRLLPSLERLEKDSPTAKQPNSDHYPDVLQEIYQDNRLEKKPTTDFIYPSNPKQTIKDVEDAWITGKIRTASYDERWIIASEIGFLTSDGHFTYDKDDELIGEFFLIAKPLLLTESGEEAALLVGCEYVTGERFTVAIRLPKARTFVLLYPTRTMWGQSWDKFIQVPKKLMLKNYEYLIEQERTVVCNIPYTEWISENVISLTHLPDFRGLFDDPVRLETADLFNRYMLAARSTDEPGRLPRPFFINPEPEALVESSISFLPMLYQVSVHSGDFSTE